MSVYEPNSRHLRKVLIFCFNMKKSVAEAHRMLSNIYGEAAINERTCREWFQRFKNGDFDVEDVIAMEERRCRIGGITWTRLVLKSKRIGMIIGSDSTSHFKTPQSYGNDSEARKLGAELKPRDVERHLFIIFYFVCLWSCLKGNEQLLERQRRKGFLHRIVTGDEKWVHYDNSKRRKSWGVPGHASTSTAKPNIHSSKVMLCI